MPALGRGLPESAYEAVLACQLETRGLGVIRQPTLPMVYRNTRIEAGFRADLVAADRGFVVINSVGTGAPGHHQDGITSIVNGLPD